MPLACVIPALDAGGTLPAVIAALRAALPGTSIIVVDDGSRDDTHAIARAHADTVMRFEHNRGKGAALRAGASAALAQGARAVVTVDADGQHDPASAPRLVAALDDADMAVGARARAGSMPVGRRVTNALASAAVGAIVDAPVPDAQSGFRAMRRTVLERVHADGDRYEFETEFLIRAARAGFTIVAVPVPTVYGTPSHFRAVRDTARVVRTIWRHRSGAFR
jgi:glycosyltransferase involved in cell wall biosynthesis